MIEHNKRVTNLLKRMTPEEKIAQLCSIWLVTGNKGRLGVKSLTGVTQEESTVDPFEAMRDGIGQITRPLGTAPIEPRDGVRTINRVQRFLLKDTRLGIPALPHEECLAGLMAQGATMFPSSLNMGSLWDDVLVEKIAKTIGEELYSVGSRQGLAPVLDVARDARWGRTEETFGEDPYLVGCLATAYVRGLQGPERRVLATLKHYVGHSFGEGGRNHAPARIGPRELCDTFMLPFEMAVRLGGAGSVMPAYHDLDGEPLHQSAYYVETVLRGQWSFEGIVVSDYEGISQLATDHRTVASLSEAAVAALKAGVDVELPGNTAYAQGLRSALDDGDLEIGVLNEAVRRVLIQKSRLGLFENPYTDEEGICLNTTDHGEVALEAAQKSLVLLKNNGTLPLSSGRRIALIGPLADDRLALLNGYSFPVHLVSSRVDGAISTLKTVKEEMEARLGEDLLYARGCDILTERPKEAPVFPGEVHADGVAQRSYVSYDQSAVSEAVTCARQADCAVLMVGDLSGLFMSGTVGEGSDASSLDLPGVQNELMNALLDSGTPLVVVVSSGRPYNLHRGFEEAAAVVQAWLPGQAGAEAIVDMLFGDANPGGKLPISIPRSGGAMPFFYNHKFKSPGTPIQKEFGSVYPFGFGLSYTEFELSDVQVAPLRLESEQEIEITCSLRNTGSRAGDEVVQIYVRDLCATLTRPVMELKAYKRVSLAPGEGTTLVISVPCDMLGFTDKHSRRVVESGAFDVLVGTSSKEIVTSSRVTVVGENRVLGSNWRMQHAARLSPLREENAGPNR